MQYQGYKNILSGLWINYTLVWMLLVCCVKQNSKFFKTNCQDNRGVYTLLIDPLICLQMYHLEMGRIQRTIYAVPSLPGHERKGVIWFQELVRQLANNLSRLPSLRVYWKRTNKTSHLHFSQVLMNSGML